MQAVRRTGGPPVPTEELDIRYRLDIFASSVVDVVTFVGGWLFELDFSTDTSWQDGVRSWCQALRSALVQRPDLTSLMTIEDSDVVITYVTRLIRVLKRYGFPEKEAVDACNILVHVALSLTVTDMAVHEDKPEIFDTAIDWRIRGMEHSHMEISSATSRRRRTRPAGRQ